MTTSDLAPSAAPAAVDDAPLPRARFVESIRRYVRRYAVFSGRASRSELWWVVLAHVLLVVLAYAATVGVAAGTWALTQDSSTTMFDVVVLTIPALVGLLELALVVPGVALTVRRLHDAGYSGWCVALGLVPVANLALLVLLLLPSNPAGARFDRGAART